MSRGAALLLEFIGNVEPPRGYQTIHGNNQAKLKKTITATMDNRKNPQMKRKLFSGRADHRHSKNPR